MIKNNEQFMSYCHVETLPNELAEGVLYISETYSMAAHKCCCGCGEEVITPLNPTDWNLSIKDGLVSLSPSIGNWGFPCKSHYWIIDGEVEWSYQMSEKEIEQLRHEHARLKEDYYQDKDSSSTSRNKSSSDSIMTRVIRKLKKILIR